HQQGAAVVGLHAPVVALFSRGPILEHQRVGLLMPVDAEVVPPVVGPHRDAHTPVVAIAIAHAMAFREQHGLACAIGDRAKVLRLALAVVLVPGKRVEVRLVITQGIRLGIAPRNAVHRLARVRTTIQHARSHADRFRCETVVLQNRRTAGHHYLGLLHGMVAHIVVAIVATALVLGVIPGVAVMLGRAAAGRLAGIAAAAGTGVGGL